MSRRCLLLVAVCFALGAQVVPIPSLYFTPGRVLARGSNARSEGFHKLRSYRIEEVRLAKPIETDVNGKRTQVDRAYRVIVTGEHFPVRNLAPFVWAGDRLIGRAQENEDQTEVTAVTFDSNLLPDGERLGLSFGEKGPRETLTERIQYTVRP